MMVMMTGYRNQRDMTGRHKNLINAKNDSEMSMENNYFFMYL
jgi:hypothetical protein